MHYYILDLVGISAAKSCAQELFFFGFIQQWNNFFSTTTHGWSILQFYMKNIKYNN